MGQWVTWHPFSYRYIKQHANPKGREEQPRKERPWLGTSSLTSHHSVTVRQAGANWGLEPKTHKRNDGTWMIWTGMGRAHFGSGNCLGKREGRVAWIQSGRFHVEISPGLHGRLPASAAIGNSLSSPLRYFFTNQDTFCPRAGWVLGVKD